MGRDSGEDFEVEVGAEMRRELEGREECVVDEYVYDLCRTVMYKYLKSEPPAVWSDQSEL